MPGISDTAKIDLITRTKDGRAELVIIEENPWNGTEEHVKLFLEKMKTYINFTLGGQFRQLYPELAKNTITIKVAALYELDAITKKLFDQMVVDFKERHGLLLIFSLVKKDAATKDI